MGLNHVAGRKTQFIKVGKQRYKEILSTVVENSEAYVCLLQQITGWIRDKSIIAKMLIHWTVIQNYKMMLTWYQLSDDDAPTSAKIVYIIA